MQNKPSVFFHKAAVLVLAAILLLPMPRSASAHAYSASFTKVKFTDQATTVTFSIDALSVMELLEEVDSNKNGILEKGEMNSEREHIAELITETVVLDKDNRQQEPKLKGMKLEKKDRKDFVTVAFLYPAYFPGDTVTLMDGFFKNDAGTNYINLISASNRGETSEAVLQGDNREWTILLTEVQQEQGTDGQSPSDNGGQDSGTPAKTASSTSGWTAFFKLGMLHILTGYDHLMFLLALLLRKQTFKQYAAIITSFTIAHSITLSLAVLGIADLPSRFVEAAIAFSICYVAAENLFRKEIRNRWLLTFGFGLIHGLGFAGILKEMAISKSSLASALVGFNIGIEAVQLALVLLALPVLRLLHKQKAAGKIIDYGSWAIILFGAFWFLERIFL
ncbi:HupE/UreJ family protein [Bacillus sp. B-jedd]|uniref:HupE/UreJ family protein n=1 Tax=Bacillus sp. B-jedd TaxID=1476857 RepID=UPI00051565A7|nr:HupE/UreJ family protein [Bacillus sp. B-jedd]CEG29123.1 HupE / UreJ protein [Bacillus sp. B-jedd]